MAQQADGDSRSVLEKRYLELVDAFGLRSTLERELDLEQDYQEHVQQVLRDTGNRGFSDQYDLPLTFCGGRVASQVALSSIVDHVMNGLSADNGDGAPVFCGFWPSGEWSASTTRVEEGSVIVVDVGLWFSVRFACQQVARALTAITAMPEVWDPDPQPDAGQQLHENLDRYIRLNGALRENTHLYLMRGPREAFRRALNLAAMTYVVAHECGHLQDAPTKLGHGWSEQSEMQTQWAENQADKVAFETLRQRPFSDWPLAAVMGPMVVLAIQGFGLRTRKAAGQRPMHWTHLAPEMRSGFAQLTLTEDDPDLGRLAEAFRAWLWDRLDYQRLYREGGDYD